VARQSPAVFEVELTVCEGDSAGTTCLIRRFPAVVGRGTDADVRLEDHGTPPRLSRKHVSSWLCARSQGLAWLFSFHFGAALLAAIPS